MPWLAEESPCLRLRNRGSDEVAVVPPLPVRSCPLQSHAAHQVKAAERGHLIQHVRRGCCRQAHVVVEVFLSSGAWSPFLQGQQPVVRRA